MTAPGSLRELDIVSGFTEKIKHEFGRTSIPGDLFTLGMEDFSVFEERIKLANHAIYDVKFMTFILSISKSECF